VLAVLARHRRIPGDRAVRVSFLASFTYVRNRSARTTEDGQPRSRPLLTFAGLSRADLESPWPIAVAHDGLASDGVTK